MEKTEEIKQSTQFRYSKSDYFLPLVVVVDDWSANNWLVPFDMYFFVAMYGLARLQANSDWRGYSSLGWWWWWSRASNRPWNGPFDCCSQCCYCYWWYSCWLLAWSPAAVVQQSSHLCYCRLRAGYHCFPGIGFDWWSLWRPATMVVWLAHRRDFATSRRHRGSSLSGSRSRDWRYALAEP